MSQARRLRFIQLAVGRLLTVASVFAVGGYLLYHAANGDHGFFAYMKYQSEETRLLAELNSLETKSAALEKDVALLRPESLDPDMLDERARAMINMAHPRDRIIRIRAD